MCPTVEKEIVVRDSAPWFCGELSRAKQNTRHKERIMKSNYSIRNSNEFKKARNEYTKLIRIKKKQYYQRKT